MSSSSLENRIQGLFVRLNSENNSRELDPLSTVMDNPSITGSRARPHLVLGFDKAGTPTRKKPPPLPISFQHRSVVSSETDKKLEEIMKINGIITIAGVKYHTDIADMEHLGELGNGTCGQVVKMRHKPSSAIIAVKQMRRSGNNEENKRIIMDIDVVLKSHDCPFIVQCLGCFITEADVWICMELMATCFDKLLKWLKSPIPESVLLKVTYATVQALSYLKEKHDVIHRDVKPSNILVDEKGNVKLCDFGISGRLVDSMAQTRSAGCAAYMAPERIEPPNPSKPDYDIRADVWSLGITLVELATGVFPYQDCGTDFEVLTKVLSEAPPTLPNDKEFSDEFRAFVDCCLTKNYIDRPKYAKLLEQPFLKQFDCSNLNVDDWFKRALRQEDLLGANSPGRRFTPAPPNPTSRRHTSLQQRTPPELQQLSNGGSVGPPDAQTHVMSTEHLPNSLLPPDGRVSHLSRHYTYLNSQDCPGQYASQPNSFSHQREQNHLYTNQRSPDKYFVQNSDKSRKSNMSPDPSGRFSPFQRRHTESPPLDNGSGIYTPSPQRRINEYSSVDSQLASPYQQRRANISDKFIDGTWQSPVCSPLPTRKHYQNPAVAEQLNAGNNTSPILFQRFIHQQKQHYQQQQAAAAQADDANKDEHGGKKRFASHMKLHLVSDRYGMRAARHQSPEPPPRLSRGSSTESSNVNNQSPLTVRRHFYDNPNSASPSLSRRYISPSPPQPPPRRLSESNSVPGSPQHYRARFHYTPEPQRRVFQNNDVS